MANLDCPRCRGTTGHSRAGISIVAGGESIHAGCMTQSELVNLPIYNLDLIPSWKLSEDTMDVLRELVAGFIQRDDRVKALASAEEVTDE
jgi:hypothetical protein